MRTLVARFLALLLAVLGLAVVSAAPASAHDRIISSDPADGTELTTSPAQITLTYNDAIQAVGNQVVVADAAGTEVAAGAPTVDGMTAALVVPTLPNGAYTVTWRVVSSDGHPIDGTFAFSVADPAAVVTEPTPEMTALEDPAVEPTAVAEDPTTSEPTPSPEASDVAADDDEPLPWTGIIIGGLLGLAVGTGLLLLSKRRKTKD